MAMASDFFKDFPQTSLNQTGLLSGKAINKLIKFGIKTPEVLYLYIQIDSEKIAELLGLSLIDTEALGTLILLDWIDIDMLRLWAQASWDMTGRPIKLNRRKIDNYS